MLRRLQDRKVALISLIVLALFIFLTAFAFAKSAVPAPVSAQSDLAARRHRTPTPTPITRHTPTPTPTHTPSPTPTPGVTPTVGNTPTPIPTPGTTPTATATPNPTPPTGTGTLQVFNEPDGGEQVILNAISSAHQSLWLEIYLLSDTNVINALENSARQGIDVRVLLEPHPYGGGTPAATISALQAAGAKAQDSNPTFHYTHEKGMVIDGTTAYIMTSNFTNSALNGKNREYGIIDTVPQDVQGVIDIFNADWNRTSVQISNPNLVVSPDNSRSKLTAFINSAKSTLLVEAEEMIDTSETNAIAAAAQRGVSVEVILPSPFSGSSDSNSAGIATLKAAGVLVEEDHQLIMHAKMMVADGQSAFVGSENFSSTSLDANREVGLICSDATIISSLQQTFAQDWSISIPMFF